MTADRKTDDGIQLPPPLEIEEEVKKHVTGGENLPETIDTSTAPTLTEEEISQEHWNILVNELKHISAGHKVEKMTTEEKVLFIESKITEIVRFHKLPLYLGEESIHVLAERLFNTIFGYAQITDLLEDNEITEIMVNSYNEIFIEKSGVIIKAPFTFADDQEVSSIIRLFLEPLNKEINPAQPSATGRLLHAGRIFRLHCIGPPITFHEEKPEGMHSISIRAFRDTVFTPEELIENNSWSKEFAEFCEAMTRARCNHLVVGGTNTGKTTALNSIIYHFVPPDSRVLTIETEVELNVQNHPNKVQLEEQKPNFLGQGGINISYLLNNVALRFRPDIIIVGESRGIEILDVFDAMGTGHPGSMSTIHSDTIGGLVSRISMLIKREVQVSDEFIENAIASSVDIVTFLERFREEDGLARRVTGVYEVQHLHDDHVKKTEESVIRGSVVFNPIFTYNYHTNELEKVGKVSNALIEKKFVKYGVEVPR